MAIVTDSAEKKMEHLPEKHDTIRQKTPLPERQMVLPSKSVSHSSFQLSLAYSGLPNGTVRQLPYGDEGMNGDIIDSVAHHRLPMTIALNARYNLNRRLVGRWWTALHVTLFRDANGQHGLIHGAATACTLPGNLSRVGPSALEQPTLEPLWYDFSEP